MNEIDLTTKIEGLKKAIAEHKDFAGNYESDLAKAEQQLKDPDTSVLKKWFYCDTLLRNQGRLYFCRLIEEIEYEESDNI